MRVCGRAVNRPVMQFPTRSHVKHLNVVVVVVVVVTTGAGSRQNCFKRHCLISPYFAKTVHCLDELVPYFAKTNALPRGTSALPRETNALPRLEKIAAASNCLPRPLPRR
jgi:hypothetical protein